MTTRWTVRLADRLANGIITIGGIGTIVAVSAVFVFLVVVVVPLFVPGSRHETGVVRSPSDPASLIHIGCDEYRVVGWSLSSDGMLRAFRLDNGDTLDERALFDGDSLSAWSVEPDGGSVALGFHDGSVRVAEIAFVTDYPDGSLLPGAAASIQGEELAAVGDAVVQRTPEGQLRRQRLSVTLGDPVPGGTPGSVVRVDHVDGGRLFAVFSADGTLRIGRVEETENLMTGEVERSVTGGSVQTPFAEGASRGVPYYMIVSHAGTAVFLVWRDGTFACYDTRDLDAPQLIGSTDVLAGDARIAVITMLLGGGTFLIGESDGTVLTTFRYAPGEDADTGLFMSQARRFSYDGGGVTALAPSPRGRVFAAGYEDGHVCLYQATSGARILSFDVDGGGPVESVLIPPKADGLLVLTPSGLHSYDVDPGHPEATLASLFRPVWYEGYSEPRHVWQSSSATDDFEPKFGLWPLVFGTLKATFYSMLFGVPLALLAAIFTSEFLSPSLRSRIKTLVESMASLPSVVLGFLGGLVIAPFVQGSIPAVMVAFFTIPFLLLLGAYLWQLLPHAIALRLQHYRVLAVLAGIVAAVGIAAVLGPPMERILFAGDLILWLDGQRGTGTGGWFYMLLPLGAVAATLLTGRFAGRWFREFALRSTRRTVAVADLIRFAVIAALAFALAGVAAGLLGLVGADPRGHGAIFDTYVQRNALVVGFVMGFAVIPLIYTIAEDALSSVPDHLRAASLGAGATPWQTAIRIVLPTAMSGLFSAIMIGLGRAVGETMIVLMAAGNTPLLEMNIFNGFRTLSANIAVELPEAVRDSTHYRTLFLAALILFGMTFVVNTVAEMVRLRFRRRSSQI